MTKTSDRPEMRDGTLQGRKESEGRSVSRLQVVALTGPPVNLGEKSIHPSASVKEEACSFLTSVRAGYREGDGHGCGSTSSLAPSIRRNRGRAGHFLAAVAVTADGERGREGGRNTSDKKEGRAERAFIILRETD